MASPADIEEERRLFYVALTRAKRAVGVSFASTRMRNGKHESNAPSRFVREIDAQYVANPLSDNDFDSDDDDDDSGMPFWFRKSSGSKFGGYSTRSTGQTRSSGGYKDYGRSGPARSERQPSAGQCRDRAPLVGRGSALWPARMDKTAPASTTRVVPPVAKPDVIDPNFVPVPMTELYEGERVEHNRFGTGIIKEITGTVPELKAVIDFDNYGSKVLLLKYAKLRPEK